MVAPGLLVAAPRSGSGKTTVALGLGRALVRRGIRVAPVKCGPDYIDAAFHAAATGRPCLNLDSFAMGDGLLASVAVEAASASDLVLAEGAMGLHDGIAAEDGRRGSAADIAARFGWPVLLVLDVSGQGGTAAAVALGLARFDLRLRIAGVVLNKVASDRHRSLVEAGFARLDIPVLGALPRDASLSLPERHLGLVGAGELTSLAARLDRIADAVEHGTSVDRIVAAASAIPTSSEASHGSALPPPGGRIALAQDAAFPFVYPHVLSGWRRAGATILPFSPLADEPPPADADCCWLPGGYPELHAGRLAGAARFLQGLRALASRWPVHGECGGYMVLGRALEDADGTWHAMADCLPVTTSFRRRARHLGYRVARLQADCALGRRGDVLTGHEFHYATICPEGSAAPTLAAVSDGEGRPLGLAGHRVGEVSGTFFHAVAHGAGAGRVA